MKNIIKIILVSLFSFTLLVGCSSEETNNENTDIENKDKNVEIVDEKQEDENGDSIVDIFEQDYNIDVNDDIALDIKEVVDTYTKAYNEGDVEGYLGHFYNEESSLKELLASQLETFFDMFNVEATIEDYTVIGKSEDDIVKVKINQITKSTDEDSEFEDNRSEYYQYFKNIGGEWYFIKTQVISEEIL